MLTLCHELNEDERYGLWPPSTVLKCGRMDADLEFPTDSSISRAHAEIIVESGEKVFIKDSGSKYGTYVGEQAILSSQRKSQEDRIERNALVRLAVGEKVRFGLLSSLFRLERAKIVVCSSSLPKSELKALKGSLEQLECAEFTDTWRADVTHLVIKEGKLTIKVANALAKCVPLVTPAFFQDFVRCLQTHQRLPHPNNFVPPLKESTLSSSDVSLAVKTSRTQVFAGKTLVFSSAEQEAKYKDAIAYAGGQTMLIGDKKCSIGMFASQQHILIASNCGHPKYKQAFEKLSSQDLHAVLESQIALAILHGSCSTYCNPSMKVKLLSSNDTSDQRRNVTIVKDTQQEGVFSEPISSLSTTMPASGKSGEDFVPETARSSASSACSEPESSKDLLSPTPRVRSKTALTKPKTLAEPQTVPSPVEFRTPVAVASSTATSGSSFMKVSLRNVSVSKEDYDDPFNFDEGDDATSNAKKTLEIATSNAIKTREGATSNSKTGTATTLRVKAKLAIDDYEDPFNFDEEEPPKKEIIDKSDLFNFDEPDEEASSKGSNKDTFVSKRKRSIEDEDGGKAAKRPHTSPSLDQSAVQQPTNQTPTSDRLKVKHGARDPAGFLSKSFVKLKCSGSAKSDVPQSEFTRSFTRVETLPLLLKPRCQESVNISALNSSNQMNVKTFKKQQVAKPVQSVSCSSTSTSFIGKKEDKLEEPTRDTRAPRVNDEDDIENLWSFDSQESSNSRKRKR